ncbi:MAG: hypothetical protein WCP97_02700 [bacterium]
MPALYVNLPPQLHTRVKNYAKRHKTSMKEMVTKYLEEVVAKEESGKVAEESFAYKYFGAVKLDKETVKKIAEDDDLYHDQ